MIPGGGPFPSRAIPVWPDYKMRRVVKTLNELLTAVETACNDLERERVHPSTPALLALREAVRKARES